MSKIKVLVDMNEVAAKTENGDYTRIDIPKDTILTILRRTEHGLAPGYICSFQVNGKNYTDILISDEDINGSDDPIFGGEPIAEMLTGLQAGGRRKRRRATKSKHRKAKKTRRSRKH
jgi:hypothetical protein